MALLAWLWVERNGGGVIPGQAPLPPEQSYQDPVPTPLSQSLESDASATRDKSTPPPGQGPGRYAEVSEPPPAPLTPEQQISGVIGGFDCTPLQIERLTEGDYAISGHVASQADLRKLDVGLSAIAHATIDISGVSVVPRPLCPVYAPPEMFNRLLYVGDEAMLTGYEASAPGTDLMLTLWCRGVTLPRHLGGLDRIEGFLPVLERALKEQVPNCDTIWRFIEIH